MVNLHIALEPSPDGRSFYQPGQMIKGTVTLSLNSEKKFRGCYVLVYGYARAHWTETRTRSTGTGKNRRTQTYTVHYEGKQVFLNSKTYLFGHDGASAMSVQPGTHKYSFACELPPGIPYTMDGRHGNISYYVEVCLDVPWGFDKEIKQPFTVVRIEDLNLNSQLRIGQKMDEIKRFCCLFCESGPLFMTVSIPYSGFAAGQKIPVSIYFKNESNVPVERTRVKLKRTISFTSYSPERKTRSDRESMVELAFRGVAPNQTVDMKCEIEVPGIMMNTNSAYCHVVRVEYSVKVEGVVGECHSNPAIELPITIGSIPIRFERTPIPTYPAAQISQMPSAPVNNQELSVPSAPYIPVPTAPTDGVDSKNDLPPSFDEAIKMAKPLEAQSPSIATGTSSAGWNIPTVSTNDEKKCLEE